MIYQKKSIKNIRFLLFVYLDNINEYKKLKIGIEGRGIE
jgi:hypothetical protein